MIQAEAGAARKMATGARSEGWPGLLSESRCRHRCPWMRPLSGRPCLPVHWSCSLLSFVAGVAGCGGRWEPGSVAGLVVQNDQPGDLVAVQ